MMRVIYNFLLSEHRLLNKGLLIIYVRIEKSYKGQSDSIISIWQRLLIQRVLIELLNQY